MSNIIVCPINRENRAWIIQFIVEHWGAEIVVSRGVVYHPQDLPGFVAIQEGEKVGLVTYNIEGESCEVVTINSTQPSSGVGTALIEAVRDIAIKARWVRQGDPEAWFGKGQGVGIAQGAGHLRRG